MNIEDDWILFLEKNPHFYELSKGDFFIRFLERLAEGAKSFSDLKALFPAVEEEDMHLIMDSLLKLRVVSQARLATKVFYTITLEGKKLLSTYKKTKEFFST